MTFEGAVVREEGVTFAVVVVKRHVIDDRAGAADAIAAFQPHFPGLPVVLMGQDAWGRAAYFERQDIARFLAVVPVRAIPWRRYAVG